MLVTEEIARDRFCPFMFAEPGGGKTGTCVASDCMAWRWDDPAGTNLVGTPMPLDQRKGHCGLAGPARYA